MGRDAPGDGEDTADAADPTDADIRAALARIPVSRLRRAGLLDGLLHLARQPEGTSEPPARATRAATIDAAIDAMDADELVSMALGGGSGAPSPTAHDDIAE